MSSSTESNRGRFWFLGSGKGPKMRAVATAATVLVVAAGALGAVAMIARTGGVGASASPSTGPSLPAAPSPPTGWHMLLAGSGVGSYGFDAEPRIAVHVLCDGPDDLIVMALTQHEPAYGVPSQATLFSCRGTGWQEDRVEFTAPAGSPFVEIYAVTIPGAGTIMPTRFWVSVELPD